MLVNSSYCGTPPLTIIASGASEIPIRLKFQPSYSLVSVRFCTSPCDMCEWLNWLIKDSHYGGVYKIEMAKSANNLIASLKLY